MVNLCRNLFSNCDISATFYRELGNELYKRCLQNDLGSEKAGAAAVWAYCLSELFILNSTPPPELVTLRSQKGFDVGTFDFASHLRKCLAKTASTHPTRGRSETVEFFWFRSLPSLSPRLSPSHPLSGALRSSHRTDLLKVYSNRYNFDNYVELDKFYIKVFLKLALNWILLFLQGSGISPTEIN